MIFEDYKGRSIRLSDERLYHLETQHPEMINQLERISEMLMWPDRIIQSRTDVAVELFYRHYPITPVTEKFLCVVVKTLLSDSFIITAYYTDPLRKEHSYGRRNKSMV